MSGGNYNHGFLRAKVQGQDITELVDIEIPNTEGADVETIYAGGSRAIGHRFNTMANSVMASLTIAHPSSDEKFLDGLAATKETVSFTFDYEDPDELPAGTLIGFASAQVKVTKGTSDDFTESPGNRGYTLHCIGFTKTYKDAGTITVDAAGNVDVTDA